MNNYGRQLSDDEIRQKAHRSFVGGLWDDIGVLQFEFLKTQGMTPSHKLLDVGCGALRGGLHFVRYLDPGNYYGIDVNASLIRAAWIELEEARLASRAPRLIVDGRFAFDTFGTMFDVALAQSLFTHLPLNSIDRCLTKIADVLVPGSRLFATYFEAPAIHHIADMEQPFGFVTHSDSDPYHYHYSAFEWLVRELPLRVRNIGAWGHPRNQHMLEFTRC
jgi:SAM-dependent methyltransferase